MKLTETPAREVITALGGQSEAGRRLGLSRQTVRSWTIGPKGGPRRGPEREGLIPASWHPAVKEALAAKRREDNG